jgi:hypothetical protein
MSFYNISIHHAHVEVSLAYRVPLGCIIDCDLSSLLRAGVAWVLEVGREVDVFGGGAGSMNIVLVVSNLVTP